MNPFKALQEDRQAGWLDFPSRGFVAEGEFKTLSAVRKGFGEYIEPKA